MDDTPRLIKAKDLKKTDRWKVSLEQRMYNIVTDILDLDPDGTQTSPLFKNTILVFEGETTFIMMDKEADVFRLVHVPFNEWVKKHIEFSNL